MDIIEHLYSDILRIIFLLLKDSQLSMRGSLSSVCRSWRATMLDIGEYWTKIKIRRVCNVSFADHLNTYLIDLVSRAGAHPLDIEWNVDLDSLYFNPPPNLFDRFLQVAPTTRWRSLQIQQRFDLPEEALTFGLPMLESLELDCDLSSIQSSLFKTIDETSTLIASVRIKDHNIWTELEIKIPTAATRLTSLQITKDVGTHTSTFPSNVITFNAPNFASRADQAAVFPDIKSLTTTHPFESNSKVPNLETLTLNITDTHYAAYSFASQNPLPNLRTLNVIGYPVTVPLQYSAPNLQQLSVDVCRDRSCHRGCTRDDLRDILCFPSDPSKIPFPKLISLTARINCDHSGILEKQGRDMKYWRECAVDLLARRQETPIQFIEFVWEDSGLIFRYDHSAIQDCQSSMSK